MNFRETMVAEQAPDIYDGPDCNKHRPQWGGSAEGDMDGDGPIGPMLMLYAKHFPPGTRVKVLEPECPNCGCVPKFQRRKDVTIWACECDFDWKNWAEIEFC